MNESKLFHFNFTLSSLKSIYIYILFVDIYHFFLYSGINKNHYMEASTLGIIESLMKTGFTKHESILYITLCKEGELTGYEAAKISGIPRSNAYLALAGLVEKGGAYRIESDVVKYTAVPVCELISNIRRQLNEILNYIEKNIPSKDITSEPYITITGKNHIINKMTNIIAQARERIYLSMSSHELEYIKSEIVKARDRGLKIVIITSSSFNMNGVIIYHNEKQPGQIRLIADTSYVLTGEIINENTSTCLFSKNRNLVHLIKDSLTNEIKLIQAENNKH